jgi:YD repeat-containing protein
MKPLTLALPILAALVIGGPATAQDAGLSERTSPYPVAETLDRLEALLGEKGVKVFARIDHAAEAKAVGLELRPMQLLIFGNPKAGTPLMQTAPSIGLNLPMKVLAWQDDQGQTRVTWNSADYLIARHGLEAGQAKPLAAIAGLIEAATR